MSKPIGIWSTNNKNDKLLLEWDYSKNNKQPNEFMSKEKAWWICKFGHTWFAKIHNRCNGRGCPQCKGNLPSETNNLLLKFPEVSKKWNFSKNKNLTPKDILPASTIKVWWICDKKHEWLSSPHAMTNKNAKIGCPYCKGLFVSNTNNIMDNKLLLSEWDYEKNICKPQEMTIGKSTKIFWKCKYNHQWNATIPSRLIGTGCPFCKKPHSNLEVRIYSELKYLFPDTIWNYTDIGAEIDVYLPTYKIGIEIDGSYWHKNKIDKDISKNEKAKKLEIKIIRIREKPLNKISSNDIQHKYGEEHIKIINKLFYKLYQITKDDKFSNYIKENKILNDILYQSEIGKITKCKFSIAQARPEIIKEWDYEKNLFLKPENISHGSGIKLWWICNKNHSWCATAKDRKNGRNCPYCYGRYATKEYNLKIVYPSCLDFWDYEKNYPKIPEDFTPKSNQSVWWKKENGKSEFRKINQKTNKYDRDLSYV